MRNGLAWPRRRSDARAFDTAFRQPEYELLKVEETITVEEDITPPPRAAGGGQGATAAAAPTTLKLKLPIAQPRGAPSGSAAQSNAPPPPAQAQAPPAAPPPLKLKIVNSTAPGQRAASDAAAAAAAQSELANIDSELAKFRRHSGSVSNLADRAKLQAKIGELSSAREAVLERLQGLGR